MSDIRRLADRIVSMRDGVIPASFDSKPLDYEGAVNAMLGQQDPSRPDEVRRLRQADPDRQGLRIATGRRPISLKLGDGEVVAITGLVGVGKTALAETLFGLRKPLVRHDDFERQALCAALDGRSHRRRRVPGRQGPRRKRHRRRTSTSTRTSACPSSSACRALAFSSAAPSARRRAGRSRISASSAAPRGTR